MASPDIDSRPASWDLHLGIGLGNICLNDSVEKWKNSLSLVYEGDLQDQVNDFYRKNNSDRIAQDVLKGLSPSYKSSLFDLSLEVNEKLLIVQITTAEFCFFRGVDLLGCSADFVLTVLDSPDVLWDRDCLGWNLFLERIGLVLRLDERKIVQWISISEIDV
ncbi:hypothetical protein [Variovorax sp. 350MFTsu5.1]|uniref:hypothetical protein n=1 Tax=Variovorax sp. 350MFTsu5.1 TaxID=3158365 RepID=UPI003AABA841